MWFPRDMFVTHNNNANSSFQIFTNYTIKIGNRLPLGSLENKLNF